LRFVDEKRLEEIRIVEVSTVSDYFESIVGGLNIKWGFQNGQPIYFRKNKYDKNDFVFTSNCANSFSSCSIT
jgi:hypothetical protein